MSQKKERLAKEEAEKEAKRLKKVQERLKKEKEEQVLPLSLPTSSILSIIIYFIILC